MTARERRWIVLAEDGRHVTIGRHTDPTDEELSEAGAALQSTGQGGWVAILEGGYYTTRPEVSVMMVREIAGPTKRPWDEAVRSFKEMRRKAIASPSPR